MNEFFKGGGMEGHPPIFLYRKSYNKNYGIYPPSLHLLPFLLENVPFFGCFMGGGYNISPSTTLHHPPPFLLY